MVLWCQGIKASNSSQHNRHLRCFNRILLPKISKTKLEIYDVNVCDVIMPNFHINLEGALLLWKVSKPDYSSCHSKAPSKWVNTIKRDPGIRNGIWIGYIWMFILAGILSTKAWFKRVPRYQNKIARVDIQGQLWWDSADKNVSQREIQEYSMQIFVGLCWCWLVSLS